MVSRTLYISGVVQGVGFRPFVYRLARRHGLKGEVANASAGVRIRLEGTVDAVTAFSREITASLPPPAVITEVRAVDTAPIAVDNDAAHRDLSGIADGFLIHDRDICQRSDDAVVRHIDGRSRFIRRSRGYAPAPIFLHRSLPPILACGAELKNAVCLTRKRCAYLSPHIGDVRNLETYRFLDAVIRHLEHILAIAPEIIAHDAHPDYLSTRYARMRSSGTKIPVQHHHAHVAAAMAENGLEGPVIGLAFDGTGYGTDGAVWGGEVLTADYRSFERAAHLAYTPMPGGDAAVREPWRMAVAYLHGAFGDALRELDLPMLRRLDADRIDAVLAMVRGGFQAPFTSSLGRLFDGVAALLDIRYDVTFEGQAAMALEMSADPSETGCYPCERPAQNSREIPLFPIIEGVVRDRLSGLCVPVISRKFHNTLIRQFTTLCTDIRCNTGLDRVVLSGGAFQNVILLKGLTRALTGAGFSVFSHARVPTHDGGISLGQAMVAAATV
ncbi:acylphosphatase [Desulfococcus sp.]|uniref:Kae1-like domain-containing protein n=1 Tax=Desulfococcus sp. TaxID=2025834 RepID=UPI003D0FE4A6